MIKGNPYKSEPVAGKSFQIPIVGRRLEVLRPSRHRDVYPFKYSDIGSKINLRIGVEDDRTCPAPERSIREGRNVQVGGSEQSKRPMVPHTCWLRVWCKTKRFMNDQ
ncbi:hypothetical protein V6N12_043715 [Hibiscus sabdariffa]|uniref:Uncharacterized protein n=1 Tax=Hibiscus sabdariffa TaxID=183260 RepID=A0ABR2DF40_9ROSI